ncbi:hypothetical protein ANANG_G00138890 [Anguilla anguilla]|uniref:Uncharacterized protein n=1 Tax=Anguilla anguilla TaxID=7936 RepID=A0A9D3MCB9_ANGAN|nr:hypothetical protein ANANG_G00138890 [Anguilla anguilla]
MIVAMEVFSLTIAPPTSFPPPSAPAASHQLPSLSDTNPNIRASVRLQHNTDRTLQSWRLPRATCTTCVQDDGPTRGIYVLW